MNIIECYSTINGDYNDVLSRLRNEKIIYKFLFKFLNDANFNTLSSALKNNNLDLAFRSAHTLKGVSQNLGFTQLGKVSDELSQALKPLKPLPNDTLFQKVVKEYNITIETIKKLEND